LPHDDSSPLLQILAGVFSLLVGAAGWFYLFYSRAAEKLAGVEAARTNALRVNLRRVGGCAMIGLAVTFYIGCVALLRRNLTLFGAMMFAVLVLMAVILVLGLVDLRLTNRLRRRNDDK
jgi:hypothetical protein